MHVIDTFEGVVRLHILKQFDWAVEGANLYTLLQVYHLSRRFDEEVADNLYDSTTSSVSSISTKPKSSLREEKFENNGQQVIVRKLPNTDRDKFAVIIDGVRRKLIDSNMKKELLEEWEFEQRRNLQHDFVMDKQVNPALRSSKYISKGLQKYVWKFKLFSENQNKEKVLSPELKEKLDCSFQSVGNYWVILNPMEIETLELKYQKYLSPKQHQASKPFALIFTIKSCVSELEIEIEFSNMNKLTASMEESKYDPEKKYICCGNAIIKDGSQPVSNLRICMKRISDYSTKFEADPYVDIRDKLTFEDKIIDEDHPELNIILKLLAIDRDLDSTVDKTDIIKIKGIKKILDSKMWSKIQGCSIFDGYLVEEELKKLEKGKDVEMVCRNSWGILLAGFLILFKELLNPKAGLSTSSKIVFPRFWDYVEETPLNCLFKIKNTSEEATEVLGHLGALAREFKDRRMGFQRIQNFFIYMSYQAIIMYYKSKLENVQKKHVLLIPKDGNSAENLVKNKDPSKLMIKALKFYTIELNPSSSSASIIDGVSSEISSSSLDQFNDICTVNNGIPCALFCEMLYVRSEITPPPLCLWPKYLIK